MAKEYKMKKATLPYAEHVDVVEPGTPQAEALLAAGYGMTIEEAQQIIDERKLDPHLWPMEDYKRAKAMIEGYTASPQVIATRPGWKRSRASIAR